MALKWQKVSHGAPKSDLKVAQKWSKSRLELALKRQKVSHGAQKSDLTIAQKWSKSRLEMI